MDTSRGCAVAIVLSVVLWALVAAAAWMVTR
jgi:hypothetical protein